MDVRKRFKCASCARVFLLFFGKRKNNNKKNISGNLWTRPQFFVIFFLRKGSIVAEFKLIFKTSLTAKQAMAPLKQETADGKLGSLEVDSNSLKLKDNNQGKSPTRSYPKVNGTVSALKAGDVS